MRKVYLYSFITFLFSLPQPGFSRKIIADNNRPTTRVYAGVDNPTNLLIEGYACRDLVFKAQTGLIKNQVGCRFDYFAANPGYDTIFIFIKQNQQLKKIGQRAFDVWTLPKPEPEIGGYENGASISIAAFKAQSGVAAQLRDCFALVGQPRYEVVKFQLVISRGSEIVFSGISQSNRFTKEMGEAFRDFQSGDKVLIFDIHSVGSDKIPFRQDPLEYTIQ